MALTAGGVAAQFTSPNGYLTTEGSSNHDYILFKYDEMRWQQLDDSSIGQAPQLVQRISWRRDGTSANDPAWAARTMDIEVVLSDSVPAAGVSTTQDANYAGNTATVFTMKPVNLPDWTAQPASTPAAFDLVLQLDQPWPYTGLQSFLWEVRTQNNTSAADYGNDFQSMPGSNASGNNGSAVGTGCVATGNSTAMALAARAENQITQYRVGYTVTNAPANQPAFVNIDFSNSNLSVPGLCANIIALPTFLLTAGTTDLNGELTYGLENIPGSINLAGATIFSQALVFDPGQTYGITLSNGRSNTFPTQPSSPTMTSRVYGYRLASGSFRAPSAWTGGIVTRFD